MRKKWKLATVLTLSTLLLFACSEKDPNETAMQNGVNQAQPNEVFQGIDYEKLYAMKDDEKLVTIGEQKLTIGEIKKKTFEQGVLSAVNQYIDEQLLIQTYKVTDEEVEKEVKRLQETMGTSNTALSKNAIRYQLAYNKAIAALGEFTEEDLQTIYKQYYEGKDERSFDELKEDLKKQAPYIMGSQKIQTLQKELRAKASIEFNDSSLAKQYEMINNPVIEQQEPTNK